MGTIYSPTTEGYQYFLTIVNDCTCLIWVYCLHAKSNVMSIFLNFYLAIQTQFGTQIKHVNSNHVPIPSCHFLIFSLLNVSFPYTYVLTHHNRTL